VTAKAAPAKRATAGSSTAKSGTRATTAARKPSAK
jgi:hypothetical protein